MFNTEVNQQVTDSSNDYHDFHGCPNCWGYLQWEERDCLGSLSIDKGSRSEIFSKNGFIRRFIKKYIG
jgi:hypothetical protein